MRVVVEQALSHLLGHVVGVVGGDRRVESFEEHITVLPVDLRGVAPPPDLLTVLHELVHPRVEPETSVKHSRVGQSLEIARDAGR